jgi:hypothetical protein
MAGNNFCDKRFFQCRNSMSGSGAALIGLSPRRSSTRWRYVNWQKLIV